jgi:branched-chain amino acid transport system substrate-binding protein
VGGLALVLAAAIGCRGEGRKDHIFVGHLADYTGATAFVGKFYGPGVEDAVRYINAHGGIAGTPITIETVDYSYKIPEAIATYKRWLSRGDLAGIQGWGTGDTEALIAFVAADKIPVWSASYSGHLTDPLGKNQETKAPAPYNFFYGPSYSDGCRALVQWAAGDAETEQIARPRFVHMGDNHPYPNAPKKACADYALELGFEVLPPIVVPLAPGDVKPQCLTMKEAGAHYAYVANLGPSVVSLLNSCRAVGAEATFLANIWGGDYLTIEAAQARDYIFVSAGPFWETDVPGMTLARAINAAGSGPDPKPTHHYLRGICSVYYMKEAMEWAKANGGVTGENVKRGMYARRDWVPHGLEGVCLPSTWTEEDHRGTTAVTINRGSWIDGQAKMEMLATIELPRRPEWLGR